MIKRTEKVTFRMTEQEKEHLKTQVKITGWKIEPYIRALIMGQELKTYPPEIWAEIVRQLAAIGNNINQIARVANMSGIVRKEEIDEIQKMQSDIWRKVKFL